MTKKYQFKESEKKSLPHFINKLKAKKQTDSDVKDFLTHLAVNRKAAASTQNQAFNALLFFFRHVIKFVPDLKNHLETVIKLHQEDLDSGYSGTFLPSKIEIKYKNAAREPVWQWFFPAKTLTFIADKNEYRRYYLHKTHVQKAIKRAVNKAKIPKRASAHTFRRSFAIHLLQANYDIRTIQELWITQIFL